jgi:hypothetical protein
MSVRNWGCVKRLRLWRLSRRWRDDTEATVRWATTTLTVPKLGR